MVCSSAWFLWYVLKDDLYGLFFGMISMGWKKFFWKISCVEFLTKKKERRKLLSRSRSSLTSTNYSKNFDLSLPVSCFIFFLSLLLLPDPDLIPSYLPTISLASSFLHSLSLLLIFLRPLSVNIFNLIFSKFVWFTNTLAFVSTSIWAVASKTSPYSLMLDLNPIHWLSQPSSVTRDWRKK